MSIPPRARTALAAGALLLLAALPTAAPAQATRDGARVLLTLKDGVVLRGEVRREGHYEIEDGQAVIFMPSGFFFIDDMVRRQYFSTSLAELTPTNPTDYTPPEEKPLRPKKWDFAILSPSSNIPPVEEILNSSKWDENWDRTIKFRTGLRTHSVHQRLTQLTPYYARTDSVEHWKWPAVYFTRELGPDQVRYLLSTHPDFADDPSLDNAARVERRLNYCDFMARAGFYDEADHELDRLLDDKPDAKAREQAEAARTVLNHWRRRDQFEDIKKLHNAGEFGAVRKQLAGFDDKTADEQTAVAVNELRDKYKAADQAVADAGRFLDELPKQLKGGRYDADLRDAAAALRADLQQDVLPRLDAFLGQARQAERQAANKQTPSAGPEALLSLAVTGWLGLQAETRPETAARIWRARQLVTKYLSADAGARKTLLSQYEADKEGPATLDDFTRMIPLLPPPEPEPKVGTDPLQRTVNGGGRATTYTLQLPPEYRPGRNYPVLIVLHQSGETPEDELKRWADAAALNGYILAAPEWNAAPAAVYGFSEAEHMTVLNTLADLRRHFAVDSDRVFLFGWGQGGTMAFDVGLSHPDLFAGVLPMSAGPGKAGSHYFRNGAFLPFYIVCGDRASGQKEGINKDIRETFENWVGQYPMMWIQYKGRGIEFYAGEMPLMFDWMRNKRREFPLQQLGGTAPTVVGGRYFASQRAIDDSFYWLTVDQTSGLATLGAKIDLENNTVLLDSTNVKTFTLWLGANAKGEPMLNLDKPMTVHWVHNGQVSTPWKEQVAPQGLDTLLDDLARRNDRERLFTAKIELSPK